MSLVSLDGEVGLGDLSLIAWTPRKNRGVLGERLAFLEEESFI